MTKIISPAAVGTIKCDNASRLASYSYLANSSLVSQIRFKQGSTNALDHGKIIRLCQMNRCPSALLEKSKDDQ
jgi:hypothetical protein